MKHKYYFYSRNVDIMDNMVSMLEKYAMNLEEIVVDRTKQLIEEKKKTDQLLYQMLPRFAFMRILLQ